MHVVWKSFTYIWKSHHKVMEKSFLCSVDNLFHASLSSVISILDVLCNATVKQHRLLGHDAHLSSEKWYVDALRWATVYQLEVKSVLLLLLCLFIE